MTGSDTGPAILVTGQAADGTSWTRRIPAVETAGAGLAQYWARGRIRDLEDRYVATYENRPELERAIIATSVDHSVLSRFTAFVAIDKRIVNKTGALKQVTQPVDLPAGWTDFDADGMAVAAGVPLYSSIGDAAKKSANDDILELSVRSTKTVYSRRSRGTGSGPGGVRRSGPPPSVLAPKPAPMIGGSPEPQAPMPLPVPPALSAPPAPGAAPTVTAPSTPSAPLLPPLPDQAKESDGDNEFHHFAVIWLAALTTVADDTAEAQEETLAKFVARLHELIARFPDRHATEIADLLVVLEASDKPVDERRQSAIAFVESIQAPTPTAKPRRAPFWKR